MYKSLWLLIVDVWLSQQNHIKQQHFKIQLWSNKHTLMTKLPLKNLVITHAQIYQHILVNIQLRWRLWDNNYILKRLQISVAKHFAYIDIMIEEFHPRIHINTFWWFMDTFNGISDVYFFVIIGCYAVWHSRAISSNNCTAQSNCEITVTRWWDLTRLLISVSETLCMLDSMTEESLPLHAYLQLLVHGSPSKASPMARSTSTHTPTSAWCGQ